MNVLDLFSGIGGFSLGLERAGMRTVAFCEREEYCRAVLKKRWPGVARFRDVRYLTAEKLKPFLPIDVVCGGFPCQDISVAGDGAGIDEGKRSGLWREQLRLIGELRPKFAPVENVAALLVRGLGRVLGDLASIGYDAEWHCIPASSLGAPHRRDRCWIIAYPKLARIQGPIASLDIGKPGPWGWRGEEDLRALADAPFESGNRWPAPLVRRVDARLRYRVHRLRALGNAVCPQAAEIIGRAIMRAHDSQT